MSVSWCFRSFQVTISRLMNKFWTGSLLKKKLQGSLCITSEETLYSIAAGLETFLLQILEILVPWNRCIKVSCRGSHKIYSFKTKHKIHKVWTTSSLWAAQLCNWLCETVYCCAVAPLLTYFYQMGSKYCKQQLLVDIMYDPHRGWT